MPHHRLIEALDAIEANPEDVYVREQIAGQWGNYNLTELPPRLVIRHVCRILRTKLRYDRDPKPDRTTA